MMFTSEDPRDTENGETAQLTTAHPRSRSQAAQTLTDEIAKAQKASFYDQDVWALTTIAAARDTLWFITTAYVKKARTAGHSWSTIGNALGITKQAAWKRYDQQILWQDMTD